MERTGSRAGRQPDRAAPEVPQEELRAIRAEHGILTKSWGPLGDGKGVLENRRVVDVAERKFRTSAQVVCDGTCSWATS